MDRYTAKKWFVRSLLAAVCLLLAALAIRSLRRGGAPSEDILDRITFQVAGDREAPTVMLRCVKDGDGLGVVTLPAYTRPDDILVRLNGDRPLRLNGEPLRDGMGCGVFPLDEALELTDGESAARLTLVASGGVATMFIDTVSGDMGAVNRNKTHREAACVTLYDANGVLEYQSHLTDKIRGRGNWTWKQSKKPYNLYLDTAADLLNMGKARKWALIANLLDECGLRNWMVYSTARALGSYNGFAPDCAFVDLYLNGRYNGLYLLCEKVEFGASRLDMGTGGYLFDFDLSDRMDTMQNPFLLDVGLAVEIKSPKQCSREQTAALQKRLADFQAALLSEDGVNPDTGRSWLEYIDLDSFARKYLVEELFENFDAGSGSQYFFWNLDDDRIYAGPCWDYDNTLGIASQRTPNCFLALREWKTPNIHTPWFPALWRQEAFRERVIELYREEFLPALEALEATGLREQAQAIEAASAANRLRWHTYYESHPLYDGSLDYLLDFLKKRVDFLSSAWIDGVDYRTVTFDLNGKTDYQFYCLPAGSSCEGLPSPQAYGLADDAVWRLEDGSPFDLSTALTEDITLYGYDPAKVE